jgi:hypothetical protein
MDQLTIREEIIDPYHFNINFKLPHSDYVLTISAKNSDIFKNVTETLSAQVLKYFDFDMRKLEDLRYFIENDREVKEQKEHLEITRSDRPLIGVH